MKTTTKYEVYSKLPGTGRYGIYETLEEAKEAVAGKQDMVIIPTEYRVW